METAQRQATCPNTACGETLCIHRWFSPASQIDGYSEWSMCPGCGQGHVWREVNEAFPDESFTFGCCVCGRRTE